MILSHKIFKLIIVFLNMYKIIRKKSKHNIVVALTYIIKYYTVLQQC